MAPPAWAVAIGPDVATARLRALPPPRHTLVVPGDAFPPKRLSDVYNRGEMEGVLRPDSPSGAVLVALVPVGRVLSVVLTRRASRMRKHAGQVAFPGGKREPGESDRACAFREAREEVGWPDCSAGPADGSSTWFRLRRGALVTYTPTGERGTVLAVQYEAAPPHVVTLRMRRSSTKTTNSDDGDSVALDHDFVWREKQTTTDRITPLGVEFVGELERLAQPSFRPPMCVTPVCVVVRDPALVGSLAPSEDECDAVFTAPLWRFLCDVGHRHDDMDLQRFDTSLRRVYRAHHFDVEGKYDVWGLTADVLMRVAAVVFQRKPDFEMRPAPAPML